MFRTIADEAHGKLSYMLSALVPAQDVPPRAGIPANLPNRGHFCPWPLQMLCWAIFVCDVNLGYKSERNLLPWGKKHTVQSLWKFYLWSISQNYKKVSDMRGNFRPLKIKIYSNLLFFFCPSFFPLFSCKWIRTLIFFSYYHFTEFKYMCWFVFYFTIFI